MIWIFFTALLIIAFLKPLPTLYAASGLVFAFLALRVISPSTWNIVVYALAGGYN